MTVIHAIAYAVAYIVVFKLYLAGLWYICGFSGK